jgi:acyl-CoA reductase-like NAD-dependent aldehyde dehydrogenase
MTDARALVPRLPPMKLFVGGRFVEPQEGGTIPVVNPATGEKLCDAPAAGAADVDLAVRAARRAFEAGPWRTMSARERGGLIRRLADLLWERREEFALVESLNNGKTFREAIRGDVGPGAGCLAYFSEWPVRILGEVLPVDGPFHTYVLKEPVGVVGAIVPWNYPTSLMCWKLGPALAAGCTVVLKPSELTPLTALKLAELSVEAGFPEGVLNVVPGYGEPTGEAIARHPDVDKVSFTGSIRTARRLVRASGETNLKKLTLELGGKSPQIVFADADIEPAVNACFWGIFGNKGETCNAGSRVLVHAKSHDAFVSTLVERARALRVGDPLDPATDIGPQARIELRDELHGQVQQAIREGARPALGCTLPPGSGAFYPPSVLADVQPGNTAAREEIFGPVAAVMRAESADAAVAIANDSRFGLGASLWTRDATKRDALVPLIEAGAVFVNGLVKSDPRLPFGGVKASGFGRELGLEGIRAFVNVKTVWVK